jgi:hypothetical protein
MSTENDEGEAPAPRTDLIAGALWVAFGAAITIGAWRMDRLERMSINPYEIPGLVPGLLGLCLVALGLMLALRALAGLRAAGSSGPGGPDAPAATVTGRAPPDPTASTRQMALVFGLTLGYALLLIGTGLPFWLGTFVFVTVFIGLLDRERQRALGRAVAQQWLRAAIYGAGWSALVTLAFEHIFLVRLP